MTAETLDRFIESWGVLGAVWGINNSTARVHALIMTSNDPLSLDDIAKRLEISRGNASMCLKELRNWGVIVLKKKPGDRRDYYISENDAQKMVFSIARERKRREFDPLVDVIEQTLSSLRKEAQGKEDAVQVRLTGLSEVLLTIKQVADRLLIDDQFIKSLLPLLNRL